ncbi:MAG: hypothetical protein PVF82_06715 [Gammaproteobacteria bacterium]|jgi:hypothetical protein
MYTRLKDIPVFEFRDTQVNAGHFNHVQVALKKLGDSIRFPIPKLKHLDLILEKEAWIIVDRVLNDVPIAAWTDFQTEHRDNLHQPIQCRLRLYHANADLILERTLEAMELLLGEQLAEALPDTIDGASTVLPFHSNK